MARTLRILQSTNNATTAPPPEAVSVESDFVVILAALLCALICVVGLIAIARCAWLRRGPVAVAGNSPRQTLANKGLKKKVLDSLPKFNYVDGEGNPNKLVASSECAICLSEFAAGDEVRVLPQCGHGFHVACIDKWLESHSSCPSCRALFAVPRCQKCGQYPAVIGGATAVAFAGGRELKFLNGDNANAATNANCNISHSVNNGFLP
ncbi:RING-H2 finger protein ATL8-like [Gastrolobium bilobum]|uniref:RING-H2 finger protein ATL8-like n=1 Tax=Gastrolobium bilobum TaxID=150636 RepID=UPI002AAF757B|nr:RING-H2 finger protein ATL8-like [Gastrolobium bilobum]